jgi:hypothetical protein
MARGDSSTCLQVNTEIHWETIEDNVNTALALLKRIHDVYREAPNSTRRYLDQAVFEAVYVDEDGISGHRLAEPFADFLADDLVSRLELEVTNPDPSSQGRGSNKSHLVEVPGVEPGSSVTSAGLLRAQPVRESRDAATHRRLRHPQPRCDVPPGREARPGGKPLKMTPLSGRVAEPDGTRGP